MAGPSSSMELAGQLSNQSVKGSWGKLATTLARLRDGEATDRPVPQPRNIRRQGEVRGVITHLLAAADQPMRAREIHRAVEQELGTEIPWSSISNCLRRNSIGPRARFRKVSLGRYEGVRS